MDSTRIPGERGGKSLDDYMMEIAFLTVNPRLARWPHCIMVQEPLSLEIVLDTVQSAGALCWSPPPIVSGHEADVASRSINLSERIKMWGLPANQTRLRELGGAGGEKEWPVVVISAQTSPQVLNEIERAERDVRDCNDLEVMASLVESLQWLYVSLWNEVGYVMFVTARNKAKWVQAVHERLSSEGRTCFSLRAGGGRYHWA